MKLKLAEKCTICKKDVVLKYTPMEEWDIKGTICSKCYSERLEKHYPGKHIRTNRMEDFE